MFGYLKNLYSYENDKYLQEHKKKLRFVLSDIRNRNRNVKIFPMFKRNCMVSSVLFERCTAANIIQKQYRNYKKNEIKNVKNRNKILIRKVDKLEINYKNLKKDFDEMRYELGQYMYRTNKIDDDIDEVQRKVHEIEYMNLYDLYEFS